MPVTFDIYPAGQEAWGCAEELGVAVGALEVEVGVVLPGDGDAARAGLSCRRSRRRPRCINLRLSGRLTSMDHIYAQNAHRDVDRIRSLIERGETLTTE